MENIGVSIVNALNDAVKLILTFIPRLVGFLVILIVGLIVAWAVSKALTFLLRKIEPISEATSTRWARPATTCWPGGPHFGPKTRLRSFSSTSTNQFLRCVRYVRTRTFRLNSKPC